MTSATDVTVCLGAVACLGGAAFFVGTVSRSRGSGLTGLAAVGCVVGAGLAGRWLEVEPQWAVAALVVGAASALCRGRSARLLALVSLPVWALGALAAHRAALPAWGVFRALGALSLASVPWLWLGGRARSRREQTWFVDLALFALFGGTSLLAGPTVLLAWKRAAIAAEGQDPVSVRVLPWWPLALAGVAFAAGLVWKLHRSRSSTTKGF